MTQSVRKEIRKTQKQYIKCVRDTKHLFYEQFVSVTGLEPEAIKHGPSNFGFQIYPDYEVRIIGDELWVEGLHNKLSSIAFVYDFAGIPETIKQQLIDAGCHYQRKNFNKGWFNQKRIEPRRAIHVDLIRLSNGFTNLFFQANCKGRIGLVLALQGLASDDRLYQDYIDAIGDAFLLGYHCNLNQNCNLAEANAAKATWELTNQLLQPFGLTVMNRVSDRLYKLKRMIGNYRTMARSPADALFNLMYIFCESELWKILDEKEINYLGVGGFAHFSFYSDLAWMGLVLDLCEALKFAGHVKLVQAIQAERIKTKKDITKLFAFKNELLYTVSSYGEKILYDLKEEVFNESNYFYGEKQSFRKTIDIFIERFDQLLLNIGQRFDTESLLIKEQNNPFELPAQLWRLTLEWESLEEGAKRRLQQKAFSICQEEISKNIFQPLVWYPSQQIAKRTEKEITTFKKFSFLFEEREEQLMEDREPYFSQLSPSVHSFSRQFKELEVKWIK